MGRFAAAGSINGVWRQRKLVSAAVLVVVALVVLPGSERSVARAAGGDTITLRLWPAGQGRIDVTQSGRAPQSCDFVQVLVSSDACPVSVTSGTPVTLTAVAEPGATIPQEVRPDVPDFPTNDAAFVRWSRFDCGGTGPCTFTPDADFDWVTAVFTPLELEVGINGGTAQTDTVKILQGDSVLDTLTCDGPLDFFDTDRACHALFPADSNVVLVASPASSQVAIQWGPGCRPDADNAASARCTVTMSNIRTFAVVAFGDQVTPPQFPFQITPRLTVHLTGTGHGRVTGTGGVDCGTACSVDLAYQSRVTLTADPGQDSIFVRWRGICSTSPACVFAAGSTSSVGAVFDQTPPPPTTTTATTTAPTTTTTAMTTTATTTGTQTTATTSTSKPKPVGARLASVSVAGSGAHRAIVVTLRLSRSARVTVRLLKRGQAKTARVFALQQGRNTLRLRLTRAVKAGVYQLTVKVGAGATARTLTRSVTIRR
jgi:hypothetical protein